MSFPGAWSRLPGPGDFVEAVVEDLADRNIVLAGLPEDARDGLAVEIAEAVKGRGFGAWSSVAPVEARQTAPQNAVEQRVKGEDGRGLVLWIDATEEIAATAWADYAGRYAGRAEAPRLCVAMAMARAEACREDKGLRRRLWRDFVTATDSRVIAERVCRREGRHPAHTALKAALIAELAGSDLALATRLAHKPLGRILDSPDHAPERIWAAQISVLFPIIARERECLLERHRNDWPLPFIRKDGREVRRLEDLEIGDMATMAHQTRGLKSQRQRLDWLKRVRNALAHYKTVPWGTLVSPIAVEIVDFRKG